MKKLLSILLGAAAVLLLGACVSALNKTPPPPAQPLPAPLLGAGDKYAAPFLPPLATP